MDSGKNDEKLCLHLSAESKLLIERAAACLGQQVDEFAMSTLVKHAQAIIAAQGMTLLSKRDWSRFIRLLEDRDAAPNAALTTAAERYKRWRE